LEEEVKYGLLLEEVDDALIEFILFVLLLLPLLILSRGLFPDDDCDGVRDRLTSELSHRSFFFSS